MVDNSARSGVRDNDKDGFDETIVVGAADAAAIAAGDPAEFYGSVRPKLGRWTDFWATHDPAPCGDLKDDFAAIEPGPESAVFVTGKR